MRLIIIEIDELKTILKDILPGIVRDEIRKAERDREIKENKLLTRSEAANFLSISLPTLDRLISKGTVKAYKVGGNVRIKENELIKSLVDFQKYSRNR